MKTKTEYTQVDGGSDILEYMSEWRLKHSVHTSGRRLGNTRIHESGWRLKHRVYTSGRRLGHTRIHESGWRLKHRVYTSGRRLGNTRIHEWVETKHIHTSG